MVDMSRVPAPFLPLWSCLSYSNPSQGRAEAAPLCHVTLAQATVHRARMDACSKRIQAIGCTEPIRLFVPRSALGH